MLSIIIYVLAIALEFVFVPLFLKYSWPNRTKKSLEMKMICSALFLICAVCCVVYSRNTSSYAKLMLAGLFFGVIGDLLIHVLAKVIVNVLGGVSFFIGHVFFILAFNAVRPDYKIFDHISVAIIIVVCALAAIFAYVKKLRLNKLALPVLGYTATLVLMLVTSVRLGILLCNEANANKIGILFTLVFGALNFVMSDATIGILLFGHKTKPLKTFNIVTYYLAQILLGTSVLFIK